MIDAVVLGELARSRRGTRRSGKRSKYAAWYFAAVRDRSRSRPASTGTARVQTSSPFSPRTRLALRRRRPRPPCRGRGTGSRRATPAAIGLPSTKQEMMSVPPEIDDSSTSRLDVLRRRSRSSPARAASRSRASSRTLREVVRLARLEPALGERVDELGRGAEVRHALGVGEVEQHVAASDGTASRRRAAASPRPRGRRPASSTSSSRRS